MTTNFKSPKLAVDYKKRPILMRTLDQKIAIQNSMMGQPSKAIVTSKFGPRIHPVTKTESNHTGVDIVGSGLMIMDKNTINNMESTYDEINGLRAKISLTDNRTIIIAHLMTMLWRSQGTDKIIVGIMGSSGRSTGLHYHIEYWVAKKNESAKLESPEFRDNMFTSL